MHVQRANLMGTRCMYMQRPIHADCMHVKGPGNVGPFVYA